MTQIPLCRPISGICFSAGLSYAWAVGRTRVSCPRCHALEWKDFFTPSINQELKIQHLPSRQSLHERCFFAASESTPMILSWTWVSWSYLHRADLWRPSGTSACGYASATAPWKLCSSASCWVWAGHFP